MYEWLLDYQKLSDQIDYLDYKLYREKQELKRWVYGDLQGVKLQRESIGANVEERIEAIEYELAHKMNDLYNAKKLIDTFEGLDNKILKLRYIENMKLEDIAEELNYSVSHIRKKHAELVRTVKFLKKYHLSSLIK